MLDKECSKRKEVHDLSVAEYVRDDLSVACVVEFISPKTNKWYGVPDCMDCRHRSSSEAM